MRDGVDINAESVIVEEVENTEELEGDNDGDESSKALAVEL